MRVSANLSTSRKTVCLVEPRMAENELGSSSSEEVEEKTLGIRGFGVRMLWCQRHPSVAGIQSKHAEFRQTVAVKGLAKWKRSCITLVHKKVPFNVQDASITGLSPSASQSPVDLQKRGI